MKHPFTWYDYFVHSTLIAEHTFTALVVAILLIVMAVLARRSLLRAVDAVVPDEGLNLRNLVELVVEFIIGVVDSIIGKQALKFVASVGSFFFSVLNANLIGVVRGLSPPTSNLNTTLGLGIVSFLAYNILAVRAHVFVSLQLFMGRVLLLALLSIVLEGVSH